ncbi:MAG: response regulator transcription factor [bacterium]|nr:response regulator transcription factor [bacterium]
MEKLFIADDENSIREGLKQIIDWESLGFSLCGEAANGREALAQILTLDPALVVLDVKMPGLHGTEVIRLAREAGFTGKCIILSGYSDFKYAQEAMKNGVRFYLTKPIDEDELYQTVSQIRDELAQEKQDSTHLSAYKNRAKNSVLRELMTGTLPAPLSADARQAFGLDAALYQVVLCEGLPAKDSSFAAFFGFLSQDADRKGALYEHLSVENRDALLLKGEQGLSVLNDLLERLEPEEASDGAVPDAVFLTYGRPVSGPEDIHLSYEDAAALLARRFFCPPGLSAVGFEALPKLQRDTAPSADGTTPFLTQSNLADYAGRLCDCLSSYNRRMAVDILQELERFLEYSSDDISHIRLFLTDLFLQIREKMTQHYPTLALPFCNNSEAIAFIQKSSYLYEILRFFSEQFEAVMGALGNTAKDTILYDVLFYIDHHFRENIKLEAIAPLFGYNSAYLGKIFTKNVGETFNSYVDHRRIERSQELLLENNLKVYEIAEQVGYRNVDYFHKKFRKYVGMSPAEFRKGHGLSADSANPFTPPP